MKKSCIFIFIVLLLPTVLAIEVNLKPEYRPGETLLAEISGNFIDNLQPKNIFFYSGRIYVPMIYDIVKAQDRYYLYAILPNKERNYTLIIKNAHFFDAGQERLQDLKFNFSVSGNLSLFAVNPGFIVTNKDFTIRIESKVKTINLIAEFLNTTQKHEIGMGRTKTLSFSIADVYKSTIEDLILKSEDTSYRIPIIIFTSKNASEEEIEMSEKLRFSKPSFEFSILKDQEFEFQVTLMNTGQENISEIIVVMESDGKETEIEEIKMLEAGDSRVITITTTSDELGEREDKIFARSENFTAETLVLLTTVENQEKLKNLTITDITEEKSCSELGGEKCMGNKVCEGTTKYASNGLCCIGMCEEQKKISIWKIIILMLIILILAAIGFFVFKKMQARRQLAGEIFKEKEKTYEERFKPQETSGSISRT
jgi:hypothetical protein